MDLAGDKLLHSNSRLYLYLCLFARLASQVSIQRDESCKYCESQKYSVSWDIDESSPKWNN